ncbi:heterokaryon incompatibility protein [Colletotrichum camelliae]|nr:heterokaryon incompatibility protein [Colletotrichum camelliae]
MEGDRVISGSTFGDGNHIHLGNNYYNESTEKCVEELYVTDPRHDKIRIQDTKGGLLDECYRWILENESFLQWLKDPQSRLLWIKGDPGKGKTMLLCGIIDELDKTHKKPVYFFCQAANHRLNTATAVLRGLIYFLVKQQPALVTYVRKEYVHAGKRLFEDANAWYALSSMLIAMLADPLLGDQILIVDALDECSTDLQRILDFVSKSSSSRAKWIVSSRNLSTIEQGLGSSTQKVRLSLELNEKAISAAVRVYIHHKVTQLASKNRYDDRTTELVRSHLTSNANDTFLWVALVYAQRFILSHRTVFEITPMQLYASALVFSPTRSLVREAFKADISKTIVKLPRVPADWDASLWTLENDDAVASLTASSQLLASLYSVGSIKIWDLNTGARVLTLDYRKNNDVFKSVMFTANDQQIASVSDNGTIKIWDLATGACLSAFDGYHGWLERDPLSTDNQPLVSSIMCQVRKIWDAVSVACVLTFEDNNSKAWSVTLTAESQQVASARRGPTVWDVISGKITFDKSERHGRDVIALTADGQRLASGSEDATIRIWNLASGKCTATLRDGDQVTSVMFSADCRWLASGSHNGSLNLWDLNTSTRVLTLEGHKAEITSIAFTANNQRLITGSTDGIIKIWNPAQNTSVSMGRRLASNLWDKAIRMWDPARNECVSTLEDAHSSSITSFQVLANGQRLYSSCSGRICKIWDTATGARVATFKGLGIFSSAESQWLASYPNYGTRQVEIKIWNALTGICVSTIKPSSVVVVSLSADGQRLASSAYNAEVHIWDTSTSTGISISTLKGVGLGKLVFSADGRRLASCHQDGKVGIWDTTTGALMSRFETTHTVPVIFSANGQKLSILASVRSGFVLTRVFSRRPATSSNRPYKRYHGLGPVDRRMRAGEKPESKG